MNAQTKEAMFTLNDRLNEFGGNNESVTVKRSDLEAVVKHLFNEGEEWSNQSALGYAIKAAESLGASSVDIQKLVGEMVSEFDWKTLEQAAEIYRKSDY